MRNPTRRLLTRVRRETRGLVLSLWARFLRKLAPRSIATSARSMGVHIAHTTPRIVVGMRKMERINPSSMPSRKVERNRIPQRLFCTVEQEDGQA
jgi:hypothetical protein